MIVITSALPGDGKTTTAVNLAVTLAHQGQRVILIDAETRRGTVHDMFGIPPAPGFFDLMYGQASPGECIRRVEMEGGGTLDVLPLGSAPSVNPADLLVAGRLQPLFERLRPQYDYIIIDTPPLNLFTDGALIGAHADALLLVARADKTDRDELRYAVQQLRNVQVTLAGTILNDVEFRRSSRYRMGSGYVEPALCPRRPVQGQGLLLARSPPRPQSRNSRWCRILFETGNGKRPPSSGLIQRGDDRRPRALRTRAAGCAARVRDHACCVVSLLVAARPAMVGAQAAHAPQGDHVAAAVLEHAAAVGDVVGVRDVRVSRERSVAVVGLHVDSSERGARRRHLHADFAQRHEAVPRIQCDGGTASADARTVQSVRSRHGEHDCDQSAGVRRCVGTPAETAPVARRGGAGDAYRSFMTRRAVAPVP